MDDSLRPVFPKSCAKNPGDATFPYRIFFIKDPPGVLVAVKADTAEMLRLSDDLKEMTGTGDDFDAKVKEMVRHHQNARMRFGIKCAIEAIRMAVGHEDGLDGQDGEHTIELLEGVTGINPGEAEQQILDYDALFTASQSLLRWINRGEGATRQQPLYGGHDCDWCGDCVQRAMGDFGKALAKVRTWRTPK